jgi:hypothetical protein
MKKEDLHDWILTVLLTVFCYLAVNNFLVQIDFWKYLIIEALLVGVRFFHMFAMKKLFPLTYNKPQEFL